MNSSRPYLIRALYEWIMDNKLTPHILVDTTYPGYPMLKIPEGFAEDGRIVLNISGNAVKRLMLDNGQITFTGSFKKVEHDVVLPIMSVLGIYAKENGQGMVFEYDPVEQWERDLEQEQPAPPRPTGRPTLKLVQ